MAEEVTPAATTTEAPVKPVATPSTTPTAEVTLSKTEHDQLLRDAARGSANQRKADLYDKINGKGASRFGAPAVVTPPTEEERVAAGQAEDRKAERGLTRLALDPAFRDVLDADPTLRNLLAENPLAVLPMLAPDALDADDAVTLVKEALVARRKPAPVVPAKPDATTTPEVKVPPAGAVNTNDKPVNEEVEAAKKIPNTELSIAKMIGAKMKGASGK